MRVSWLAVAGLALAAGVPAGADEWSRQYAVKGRPDVVVKTGDGPVRIEPGAPAEVAARVTTTGWKIGPGDVVIQESQSGDRVEIEVRLPKVNMGWGNRKIEVALRVPAESNLEVHTGDGGISLAKPLAVTGEVKENRVHGQLGAGGPTLSIHTGDGRIRIEGM
jgi:hypothetical protein